MSIPDTPSDLAHTPPALSFPPKPHSPKGTTRRMLQVVSRSGLALLTLCIATHLLEDQSTSWLKTAMESSAATAVPYWLLGIASMLIVLALPLVFLLLVLASVNTQESLLKFFKRHFESLVIEQMRSLGAVLLWSLVLIVPGVIRYLQLWFVAFETTLNPRYLRGEIDALTSSTQKANRNKFKIVALGLVTLALGPLLSSTLDPYVSFQESAGLAVLIILVEMLISVLLLLWLLQLWENISEPYDNTIDVCVDTNSAPRPGPHL